MSLTFIAEREVALEQINIGGGTQSRCKINEDVVISYAYNMSEGDVFPASVLVFDGKEYWLADGFHRYHANRKNGSKKMLCKIANGTLRDAILYSYSANGTHGLQMTTEDKRRIVLDMLNDFEWSEKSDRWIAKHCHVSHPFVAKLRASLSAPAPAVIKTQDGKVIERKPKQNKVIKPAPELAPVQEKNDEQDDAIKFLMEENDKLKDQLAKATANDPDFSANHVEELRQEVNQLKIELNAVTKSRDMYQKEATELKKQVAYYQRQAKKAA